MRRIPNRGYCISRHGAFRYDECFTNKAKARRAAKALAKRTRETVDLVQVQNQGNMRFVIDEFEPGSLRELRGATKRWRIRYRDDDPGSPTFSMTVKADDREQAELMFWDTGADGDDGWIIESITRVKAR